MIWKVVRTRKFMRAYKRLNPATKRAVDLESERIAENPDLGSRKVGSLSHVYVHKFHFQKIIFLLAYSKNSKIEVLSLEMIGPHENFYRDLTL
jgi:mRNA interferase RelE/StbE